MKSRCLSNSKWYLLEVKQSSSRTTRLVSFRGSYSIRMKSCRLGPQPTDVKRSSLTCSQGCQNWNSFILFYQRIRLGEEIKRDYDDPVKQSAGDEFQELNTVARKTAAFSNYIHAVILVLKANDPRLEEGIYRGTLQNIRDHFRTHGNNDINQW